MRILGFFHGYPPEHNAGAEYMLHAVNKFLVSMGHEVFVLSKMHKKADTVIDGVKVLQYNNDNFKYFNHCDVVFSHLDFEGDCINRTRQRQKKMVSFLHNDYRRAAHQKQYIMIVHNSIWMWKKLDLKQRYQCVLPPPVFEEDYRVKVNKNARYITLANVTENKGGSILVELAKRMPQYKFLGVKGAYGDQVVAKDIPNLKYINNTPDMRKIYKQSKIVIMPSSYESWGRVATEAICSGIPVIAHPTDGLKENLGDAGLFANRNNLDEWVDYIEKLMTDKEYYDRTSEICLARYQELNPYKHLEFFERKLTAYVASI